MSEEQLFAVVYPEARVISSTLSKAWKKAAYLLATFEEALLCQMLGTRICATAMVMLNKATTISKDQYQRRLL
jgi:hypothetical protein